jgi:hypothetical protein
VPECKSRRTAKKRGDVCGEPARPETSIQPSPLLLSHRPLLFQTSSRSSSASRNQWGFQPMCQAGGSVFASPLPPGAGAKGSDEGASSTLTPSRTNHGSDRSPGRGTGASRFTMGTPQLTAAIQRITNATTMADQKTAVAWTFVITPPIPSEGRAGRGRSAAGRQRATAPARMPRT